MPPSIYHFDKPVKLCLFEKLLVLSVMAVSTNYLDFVFDVLFACWFIVIYVYCSPLYVDLAGYKIKFA